ncbi:MAG: hypothetical protein HYT93_00705 [Parcubacteria group bacterium]|nr:hypothetical protein [Parcubacteria group bacterium]
MLYEDYMVVACGMRESKERSTYFCELVGNSGFGGRNHKINFSLIIKGCVGEKEYRAKYDAVMPHIKVGDLLHCEFVWQWHGDFLNLCLSGFIQVKPCRLGSIQNVSAEDFLNPDRGYWVRTKVVGKWVHFPGVIHCGGNAFIPLNLRSGYPQLVDSGYSESAQGALVWKPKPKRLVRNIVREFFKPLFQE